MSTQNPGMIGFVLSLLGATALIALIVRLIKGQGDRPASDERVGACAPPPDDSLPWDIVQMQLRNAPPVDADGDGADLDIDELEDDSIADAIRKFTWRLFGRFFLPLLCLMGGLAVTCL